MLQGAAAGSGRARRRRGKGKGKGDTEPSAEDPAAVLPPSSIPNLFVAFRCSFVSRIFLRTYAQMKPRALLYLSICLKSAIMFSKIIVLHRACAVQSYSLNLHMRPVF